MQDNLTLSYKNGDFCLAKRKEMRVAQHCAWLFYRKLCVRTHTKAIELFFQNEYVTQSEVKVLSELAISPHGDCAVLQ